MDPDAGKQPRGHGFLAAEKDWLHIDAGNALENPIVTLYTGDDPGAESGWDEVEEITVISTTGFLALCDSGYEPLRKENLATAGAGPYLIRVHASDRSSDGKKPRFLIQVIPGERTGAEAEPASSTIEESAGPLLVRTAFEQPDEWTRLLQVLEGGSEHYKSITVIDNPAYAGFTADQVQARIGRDDEDWPNSTVLAAYRPQGKGRVERQVLIVRDHVLAGRAFSSVEEMDAAFAAWVPQRRAQIHKTHREVIGHRAARDHAALKPLPPAPFLVAERHLRPVGKDCLVAFGGNLYSVPARKVRPRQLVEIRATKSQVMLHSTVADASGETLLAMHPRAVGRGVRVVEEQHWDGLPTGKGRRTTTGDVLPRPRHDRPLGEESGPLQALLNRAAATRVEVGRRPLSVYDELTGTRPFTSNRATKESS
ncbi:DUF6924 domain-containing protein [Streptomyces sp. NPDC059849]|uniref:Mu transposase domain-containing protein n=1 Tax=Streptomyces sp. NPDC059849 TaxID=3346969 RepID=UPI00365DAEB5